jgi:hypothetical protein
MDAFKTGAAIAQATARLKQQAKESNQQFAMEGQRLQAQREQREQENLRDQQQQETGRQYREAQLGLQKQKLDEQKQMNDAKLAQATQSLKARQQLQQGLQQIDAAVDSGQMTPEQGDAMKRRAIINAGSMSATGAAASVKALTPPKAIVPPSVMDIPGSTQKAVYGTPGFKLTQGTGTGKGDEQLDNLEYKADLAEAHGIPAKIKVGDMKPEDGKKRLDELAEDMKKIRARRASGAQAAPTATGTTGQAPAAQGKEVRKITKDGRVAIFDADSKQFIRWADQGQPKQEPETKEAPPESAPTEQGSD